MAREEDRPVQESVLDRLIGDDAEVSAITRSRSVRDLKAAVRRDLEWLLNTRAVATPPPESMSNVRESVYTYGISDITSLSADDPKARARLRNMIEEAIRIFEPRLTGVQVVEASMLTREARQLRFSIQAVLRLDPSPERILFDTVLDVSRGLYAVKGESGA
jgi:type VI secretion system protein ImpF